MPKVTYRHEVPFGHRLMHHAGKCRFPHGHNYLFEVSVTAPLDADGMVIDFSVLKGVVRTLLDRFDHAFVVHRDDEMFRGFNPDTPLKLVILNAHPTAENLALLVAGHVRETLGIDQVSVTCHEQRDCWATADEKSVEDNKHVRIEVIFTNGDVSNR